MKTSIFVLLALISLSSPAFSHGEGGGVRGLNDFGAFGFGFDGGHHDFGEFGLGFSNAENAQARFESQFESLKTKYDDGVVNTTDFFNTSTYDSIVSKTERLDDRYGLFVSSVSRSIDRIGNLISITNDDIAYFDNLLADYQSDTTISASRLDRIEAWISRITDRLNSRVDSLTAKQTTLQNDLPTYQAFQMDIDNFLSDIQTAGGGTSNSTTVTSSNAIALASTSKLVQGAQAADMVTCAGSPLTTGTAVPEPSAACLLLLIASGVYATRQRCRARR